MAGKFVGRRVVATGPGQVEIGDWSVDAPGPGQVVVQADKTLISPGTEMSRVYNTHRAARGYPTNIGYLGTGKIAALGDGVDRWQVGQRVLVSMGHISHVLTAADNDSLTPLPDDVPSERAVYTNLASISLRGARLGQVVPGRRALVLGQGLIGLVATYFAKRFGAGPVFAADLCEQRLDLARKMGADEVLIPPRDGFVEKVLEWLGSELPPVVIDATGTPDVIAACPSFAADNGRIVVLGGVHKDVTLDFYTDLQKRNLQIRGCGYCSPGNNTGTEVESARMCLDVISRGELDVAALTTHIVSIDEGPKMYRLLHDSHAEALGVVFDWSL